jgi:hypothetical protein
MEELETGRINEGQKEEFKKKTSEKK